MPRVLYYAREESQLQKAWLGIPAGTGNARQTGRREQSGVTARRLTRARVRSQRRREQSRALLGFRLRLGFGLRKLTSGSSLKTSIVPLFPDPTHLNSFVTSATVKCVVRPMCECRLTIVSKRGAEQFPLLRVVSDNRVQTWSRTIVVEYLSGRVQLWSRTTAASWPGRVLFGSRAAGSVFMGLHWFACLSRLWWKFLMLMFHTVIWILFPDIVAWSSNDVLVNVAW
jgi:hypothetical protein